MTIILKLLGILFLLMVANILTGLYNKVGKEKIPFSKKTLINGIIKAFIIAFAVVSLAIASTYINLGVVDALAILTGGILLYATKIAMNLYKIFGISPPKALIQQETEIINAEISE